MNEQESIAYIEEWDVTEAAKVLKWYENDELLRPCDCDTMVAIETEDLRAENVKLRELVADMWPHVRHRSRMCGECELPCDTSDECLLYEPMRQRMHELGVEVDG